MWRVALRTAPTGNNSAKQETNNSGDSNNTDESSTVTVNGFMYDETAFKAEEAANRAINLSYGGGSLCTSPYALAYFLGCYENEGLEVNIISVESDKEALSSGKIDGTGDFMASWLPAISNGVGFTFTTGIHTGCGSCVVLADSGITSFADAVGETIAVSGGFGSGVHNYAMRAIIHEGQSVDDYDWVNFDASLGLEVLKKGDATVLVGADQMVQKWIDAGEVVRIHSNTFDPDFKDEPCCVFGLSTSFIENNPICAEKITRAAYRAALWVDQSDENMRLFRFSPITMASMLTLITVFSLWISGSLVFPTSSARFALRTPCRNMSMRASLIPALISIGSRVYHGRHTICPPLKLNSGCNSYLPF